VVTSQTGGAFVRVHDHFSDGHPDGFLLGKQRHQVGKDGLRFETSLCGITFVVAAADEVHASARRADWPMPNIAGLQVSL
jgi:hypothetical protein